MPFADESQIGSMNFARPVRGDPRVRAVGLVVCVGFLVALLRGGHLAHLALGVVVLLTLASSASRRLRPQRSKVHFSPQVECMGVPNLLIVEEQRKAQLWWQPEDFADFLKVRLEIAKAYKAAANSLGVEMNSVCSVGPHSKAGYQAMCEAYPRLKDESRRGLGLGRKRQRAKNRDAYIAAVVKEQRRQHELGMQDEEGLARVAMRFSQKDQEYAHFLANSYYEQDRADITADDNDENESPRRLQEYLEVPPLSKSFSKDSVRETSPRCVTFVEDLADTSDPPSPRGRAVCAKGFGLSRGQLQAAGLSVTGHALLLSKKSDVDDSEMSGAESDIAGDFE